jgi:hypothetical protein
VPGRNALNRMRFNRTVNTQYLNTVIPFSQIKLRREVSNEDNKDKLRQDLLIKVLSVYLQLLY